MLHPIFEHRFCATIETFCGIARKSVINRRFVLNLSSDNKLYLQCYSFKQGLEDCVFHSWGNQYSSFTSCYSLTSSTCLLLALFVHQPLVLTSWHQIRFLLTRQQLGGTWEVYCICKLCCCWIQYTLFYTVASIFQCHWCSKNPVEELQTQKSCLDSILPGSFSTL